MWFLKAAVVTIVLLIGMVVCLVPLYLGGYISRELVVAASPDGSTAAVCRGWYPHGMEYELWLRQKGEWFGRKVGPVGSESMGRCAAVAWSPDGSRIATVTTGGFVTMWDGAGEGVIGTQRLDTLVYRDATESPYVTPYMVRTVHVASADTLRIGTCERLWSRTHLPDDAVTCAGPERSDIVSLRLNAPSRGSILSRYVMNRHN